MSQNYLPFLLLALIIALASFALGYTIQTQPQTTTLCITLTTPQETPKP